MMKSWEALGITPAPFKLTCISLLGASCTTSCLSGGLVGCTPEQQGLRTYLLVLNPRERHQVIKSLRT